MTVFHVADFYLNGIVYLRNLYYLPKSTKQGGIKSFIFKPDQAVVSFTWIGVTEAID